MRELPEVFYRLKRILDNIEKGRKVDLKMTRSLFTSEADYRIFLEGMCGNPTIAYDLDNPSNPYVLLCGVDPVIIGVNEDGKLFANILEFPVTYTINNDNNRTFNHYSLLGYNYDSRVISESGRYRVQGDLVLEVAVEAYTLDEYIESIRRTIYTQLEFSVCSSIKRKLLTRTLRHLHKLRIGCTLDSDYILIPITHHVDTKSFTPIVERIIYREACKYGVIPNSFIYSVNRAINITLDVLPTPEFKERLHRLYSRIVNKVLSDILKSKEEKELIVGNHIIKASSYPTYVRVELPNFFTGETLTIHLHFSPEDVIITDTEILVEHDEHDPVVVKLEAGRVYRVVPTFTSISELDTRIRNELSIRKVIKEGGELECIG